MVHHIACVSDTHGQPPPEIDEAGVLVWLHAGDLIDGANELTVDDILPWLTARTDRLLMVRGNHDWALDGAAIERRDISGSVRKLADGLFVAGVGFQSRLYYDLPGETDLEEVCDRVRRQARRLVMPSDRLILLTHYPPDLPGLLDPVVSQAGHTFACVRELMRELGPVAVVQGHVHEWFGQSATVELSGRPCLIVNPGPRGALLEVDMESGACAVGGLP